MAKLTPCEVAFVVHLYDGGNGLGCAAIVREMDGKVSALTVRLYLEKAGVYVPLQVKVGAPKPVVLSDINKTMAAWASKPLMVSNSEASA